MAQFFLNIFSLLACYVYYYQSLTRQMRLFSRKINNYRWAIENLWHLDKRLTLCHRVIVPRNEASQLLIISNLGYLGYNYNLGKQTRAMRLEPGGDTLL